MSRKKSVKRMRSGGRMRDEVTPVPRRKVQFRPSDLRSYRKKLPNLMKIEDPEDASSVCRRLVYAYWNTKNPAKRAAIREHLLEAANETAGVGVTLSGHLQEWAQSRERIYRSHMRDLEPNAHPPEQKYFSNKLYHKHKDGPYQTEDEARAKINAIRADDRYYQHTGMGYRAQEWGDLWHIYFRLNTGMMNNRTMRFE